MINLTGLSPWFFTVFTCLMTFTSVHYYPSYLEQFKFPEPTLNETYDFIIVGAGSAGSVVANRLSEVKNWKILLVESGGEEDVISDTPLLATTLWNTDKDWNYTSVEQKYACRGTKGLCQCPRGHVLGGSSTLNFMCYVRGNKFDFDNWKNQGNDGWGYDDVLPYFLKSEDMRIESLAHSKYHSTGGYLTIEGGNYKSPVQSIFINAGREMGFNFTDYNGEHQTGLSYPQLTMRNGARCSTGKAFLSSIKDRPNIHILQRTFALKVNLNEENDKAEGVTLIKDGKTFEIKANKEVILSAGAINSPKLLMLSGIGPKNHLEEIGIAPKLDLPVGKNLVDHAYINLLFKINQNITITRSKVETIQAMTNYARNRTGPLSSIVGLELSVYFTLDKKDNPIPDIQTFMTDFYSFLSEEPVLHMTLTKLRPKSIGLVKLRSSDPYDPPLIDPRFFNNPKDFKDSVKGCMIILELMSTEAFSQYKPEIFTPDKICQRKKGAAYCKCAVKYFSNSMYHPTGTARMSQDGVVSPKLNVWGISNLRIIDASIMPNITSGNTNAPTIMIAEKGADIIKKQWNELENGRI